MRIVGYAQASENGLDVHTIDIWFSRRRNTWVVERLDAVGDQVGPAYHCAEEDDAAACLEAWLQAHGGTHLCSPRDLTVAEKRILAHRSARPRRAA